MTEEVKTKPLSRAHHRHRAQSIIQFQSLDQLEDEVTQGFYETTPPKKCSRKRVVAAEIIYGLYWWMSFNSLSSLLSVDSPLSLWQRLSLITILVAFSVSFACVGVLQRACSAPFGLMCLRVLGVAALASYQFTEPVWAVLAGGIGGGACILAIVGGLWNLSILDKYRRIHCHLLAFVLLQNIHFWLPRHLSLTFWHAQFLGLIALVTICFTFVQDHRTPLVMRNDLTAASATIAAPKKTNLKKTNFSTLAGGGDRLVWAWLGAGFGCHLFIAWSMFGESGIMMKWVELNPGLTSITIRILSVAVLCLGIILSNEHNFLLLVSAPWLIIVLLGYLMFVHLSSSTAAIGGLIIFLHLMSLWPQLYSRLTDRAPLFVLPVAVVTYLATLSLAHVSVGGYSWLNAVMLLSLAVQWYGLHQWLPLGQRLGSIRIRTEIGNGLPLRRRPSYTVMVGRVIRRLSTVLEQEEAEEEEEETEGENRNGDIHRKRLQELLSGQEAEIKHFEVKKLRKIMLWLVVLAVLGAAASARSI